MKLRKRSIALTLYFILLFIPIYWMIITSLKTDVEILKELTFYPHEISFDNYKEIFTNPFWRSSFMNSLTYVFLNVVITLTAAVPGAYAFSRWKFRGSNHLFFWLLTNRMAPAAVFMVPFTELYYLLHIYDTCWAVALAHCLFNIPLAIWILEGFMSGIPREIDETAFVDGYTFPQFFRKIFFPLIGPGIGVTAFFAFTFSWVELILAKALTVTNAKPAVVQLTVGIGAEGVKWGLLAAAGFLTIIPGAIVVYFVRNYMAKGFALGRV
ncbi:carbohydrate ABC transporter permease [Desulfobaculum bizertense]|uniref:Carbohydrate ABC transporter membrane protein 2, CUT1 family (TC 3.A.1.1.-) n=1 Tax=Desulfobaculum bizertense DSM 18034 TaxID=1121442 RepID=A0A1T4VH88_9BACT|nr:carbohydrate ABC transporter permease [Desulfobaculum bizertense]UIJ37834.1 carbohydrate ABC transporter permease [Desulfobaculum bizertense]SKA64299.1 carbohydrate ABC transporter membrane protein 2, CUT1 family (TC 3.A.1.1.-) [Desulfobaculum bizertense DSM 18034]